MSSKLPSNLVKRPTFDSPLRRTALAVVEPELDDSQATAPSNDDVASEINLTPVDPDVATDDLPAPAARPARSARKGRAAAPEADAPVETYPHRMTVRFSAETWKALQRERGERTLAGERTISAAEIAREVLDAWAVRVSKKAR